METKRLQRRSEYAWVIEPYGKMRVPAVIYGDEGLIRAMDEKVCQQATNVAGLPGIVKASYAMPDAHWGYGFPIGGVAAFDAAKGGVISAGGVGF
ncbi:MAG: RtcB family protein, partial [Planctomycetota bacterium]